jgi:hypothetical protein
MCGATILGGAALPALRLITRDDRGLKPCRSALNCIRALAPEVRFCVARSGFDAARCKRSCFLAPVSVQATPKEDSMIRMSRTLTLLFLTLTLPIFLSAQAPPPASDKPFVVEYYYKAKWGHADEFLKLFKKNHYPVLKKEMEMGRITKVWVDQPRYHTTEDGRWDFRVTIVFKNATVANEPFDEAALQKQMYPDQ